jgi:hypothetical protein
MNAVLRPRWLRAVGLSWLCLFLPGCRNALGPEKMPVATVDGRVTERGRPLSVGWIEFVPVDGTVGLLRSARLRPDGTFHATRVPVGLNLIRLVNVDIDPRARRVFGAFNSPIRRTIAEHPDKSIEIDIIDEAIKFKVSYPQEAPLAQPEPRVAR